MAGVVVRQEQGTSRAGHWQQWLGVGLAPAFLLALRLG